MFLKQVCPWTVWQRLGRVGSKYTTLNMEPGCRSPQDDREAHGMSWPVRTIEFVRYCHARLFIMKLVTNNGEMSVVKHVSSAHSHDGFRFLQTPDTLGVARSLASAHPPGKSTDANQGGSDSSCDDLRCQSASSCCNVLTSGSLVRILRHCKSLITAWIRFANVFSRNYRCMDAKSL